MSRPETRRHERVPSSAVVKLRWLEASGVVHFARGKILNSSKTGLCVELVEAIKPLSYVTLNAPELSGMDWATGGSVRYCAVKGAKHLVGLELRTGAGA